MGTLMVDIPLLTTKMTRLERCLARIKEKLPSAAEAFTKNWDLQDIVFRNLQNAIQLCIDMATHIISDQSWPPPQKTSDVFTTLESKAVLSREVSEKMKRLVGFRNLLVHDYANLDIDKAYNITKECLALLPRFSQELGFFFRK